MKRLKKLFGPSCKVAPRNSVLTNPLLEQKLARLSRYKSEIESWEAMRERILGDLEQQQQALKQDLTQLQELEDPVKKRYLMKSHLQQWRDNDLTLDCQQRELNTRITELTAQFTHELSVLATYTPWLENRDIEELLQDTVLVVIDALIGICQRLNDTRAKPELARAIGDVIDCAAALDARAVHAHTQIVKFRTESPYLRDDSGILRNTTNQRSLRLRSSAHHLQPQRQPLDK
ncbi:MAG: hypothetical protein ACP5E9_08105 [Candidatus Methanospirareceae archaeon]